MKSHHLPISTNPGHRRGEALGGSSDAAIDGYTFGAILGRTSPRRDASVGLPSTTQSICCMSPTKTVARVGGPLPSLGPVRLWDRIPEPRQVP